MTPHDLRTDLERLGVEPGATLIVHSSLSAIGWVVGGAPALVRALIETLGPKGTLVMPAATPLCADPADWPAPKLPPKWLPVVREHLPVFDRATTPTTLGAVPETFRNWPGTLRSDHPLESVCARGPNADCITRDHPLEFSEGEAGPFGRLHELDAQILLLGVGFNRCTALHYAESLVEKRRVMKVRFPAVEQGARVWREVANVADDNDTWFPLVGREYVEEHSPRAGTVGSAESTLLPMREFVAHAVRSFERKL